MKRTSRSGICALLVAITLGACATPPAATAPAPAAPAATGPAPQSWGADEAQIRAAMQESADAWNRGDLKGHLAIYVDTVTFMTRDGPRPGVAAIEESFTRTFFQSGQPKQNLRFEQVAVRSLAPGSALGTGRFILSGGGQPDATGWFTLVWCAPPPAGAPSTTTRADARFAGSAGCKPSSRRSVNEFGIGGYRPSTPTNP